MCSALIAKSMSRRKVILEKQPVIGGPTVLSGGIMWEPNKPLMAEAGSVDRFEKSLKYLRNAVTYDGPATSVEQMSDILDAGPKKIAFLRAQSLEFRHPKYPWPDYYDDLPGWVSSKAEASWPNLLTPMSWAHGKATGRSSDL